MDSVLFGRLVDPPLDRRGELEAEALAERFVDCGRLVIETSPRARALQTAVVIAARANRDVRIEAALDEVDFGRWSGLSFATLLQDAEWRRWNEKRGFARTPTGDSMPAVQDRVIAHMRKLHVQYPSAVIALVTHAEIIRAALLYCLEAPLDDYARYLIDPASLTTISMSGDALAVHGVSERLVHERTNA
ncbi:MAG TPA: histidine phosphatase family protein [Steroidobacter sp.]|jgi:probable phosphoglycerate mutase|nr:histidine phosphatase family protein [Steroidobacter sp.]